MKKCAKGLLVPWAAVTLTIGASMISFAATGWQAEHGGWSYYTSDGERASESWKKSGDHWFWINEDGEMATDTLVEDGENYYYVNEAGARVANEWRELENTDDGDDASDTVWYYFGATGKAYKGVDSGKTTFKTIGSASGGTKKYAFDQEGRMLYGWVDEESQRLTEEDAWKTGAYYLGENGDGAQVVNAWKKLDLEAYENEDEYWFYALKSGEVVKNQIKKINGYYYGFNEVGEMLSGLYKLSVDESEIISYEKIESERDLPAMGDGWNVYYFGDSPKEGVMKLGTTTLELDGETYSYNFRKSGTDRGAGYDGIQDDSIYAEGRLLKADRDEKLNVVIAEEENYLINTLGKVQKNKINVKDGDDTYYCTDSKGVVTYEGSQKWVKGSN